MKLKYYLRGLGVGVVLTAVIMGVVLGPNGSRISDEEVIRRAKQLGMVEAESTLSSYSDSAKNPEVTDETLDAPSDEEVDQTGEKIPEEVHEGESQTGESVPEVAKEAQGGSQTGESSESIESEEDVKLAANDATQTASTDVIEAESKTEGNGEEQAASNVSTSNNASSEQPKQSAENTAATEEPGSNSENNAANESTVSNNDNSVNAEQPDSGSGNSDTSKQNNEAANPSQEGNSGTGNSSDVNYVVVVLPSGSESDTCARILRESGVIEDGVAFNKYLVSSGLDRKIRSGTKQIPKGASFEEIAKVITR